MSNNDIIDLITQIGIVPAALFYVLFAINRSLQALTDEVRQMNANLSRLLER